MVDHDQWDLMIDKYRSTYVPSLSFFNLLCLLLHVGIQTGEFRMGAVGNYM